MSLESDIYNSPKTSVNARMMLWQLLELEFESVTDGKAVFKKSQIDPDMPVFSPLMILKEGEGGAFDGVPNARRLVDSNDTSYVIEFVSLNKLKELLEHPSVAYMYEIDKPAYPAESIKQHYPKQRPPKPRGPQSH